MTQFLIVFVLVAVVLTDIGTLVVVRHILKTTMEVKHEVKTGNDQTLAQLADAIETRRIEALPEESRTLSDLDHLADMPKDTSQRDEK